MSFYVRPRFFAPDQFLSLPDDGSKAIEVSVIDLSGPGSFSEFNGPGRTGVLPDVTLAPWGANPPELLWKKTLGAGWSGFVAADGLAITQEQRGENEMVTAYDVETGDIVWFYAEKGQRFEEEMGGIGPRATPTIDGDLVFAQGATGILVCLNRGTGELVWRRNIVDDVGSDMATDGKLILWGRSGSPLVVGDKVIVPGGGKDNNFTALIAYDRSTGDEVWRGGSEQISYSTPVLMNFFGSQQIVIVNEGSVAGYDPADGNELWRYEREGNSSADANTSQPRQVGVDRLLVSKGYSMGAELLQLNKDADGTIQVSSEWANPRVLRTKLTSAVVQDGYAYGLNEGILECVELETGKRRWKGGRYRHGQLLLVGNQLIVLSEDGSLYQIEASPEKPEPTPALPAISGITWNNLCLWRDFLIVRNARQAACFRVKADWKPRPLPQDEPDSPAAETESNATVEGA